MKKVRLNEISEITQGNTPSRSHPEYWNGTIPWVPTALIQNQIITKEMVTEYITEEGLRKSSMRIFPKGTVLMAMIGQGKTRGQVALLDFPATINQNAAAVLLTNSNVDGKFLYHQLRRKYNEIRAMSNGAGQQNLNAQLIGLIAVCLPETKDQRQIAAILDSWDSAIEKTEHLIELKEQQFAHLLHDLIVTPSAHWSGNTLDSVIEPVSRKNTARETTVLTSSAELGLISQLEYYKKNVSADDVSGYYLLERGEFAYNRSSAKGYPYGAIKRLDRYERGVLSTLYLCFRLRPGLELDSDFLTFYFESGRLDQQLAEVCQEGARSHGLLNITKSDFFDLVIYLPGLVEQKRIAKILSLAQREIELLRKSLALLGKQKSFLMSKLLSGEWEAPSLGAKGR